MNKDVIYFEIIFEKIRNLELTGLLKNVEEEMEKILSQLKPLKILNDSAKFQLGRLRIYTYLIGYSCDKSLISDLTQFPPDFLNRTIKIPHIPDRDFTIKDILFNTVLDYKCNSFFDDPEIFGTDFLSAQTPHVKVSCTNTLFALRKAATNGNFDLLRKNQVFTTDFLDMTSFSKRFKNRHLLVDWLEVESKNRIERNKELKYILGKLVAQKEYAETPQQLEALNKLIKQDNDKLFDNENYIKDLKTFNKELIGNIDSYPLKFEDRQFLYLLNQYELDNKIAEIAFMDISKIREINFNRVRNYLKECKLEFIIDTLLWSKLEKVLDTRTEDSIIDLESVGMNSLVMHILEGASSYTPSEAIKSFVMRGNSPSESWVLCYEEDLHIGLSPKVIEKWVNDWLKNPEIILEVEKLKEQHLSKPLAHFGMFAQDPSIIKESGDKPLEEPLKNDFCHAHNKGI